MAGKIEVLIEQGDAKRQDLKYYPYWSLAVSDRDDGTEAIVTPTFAEMKQMLIDILLHERKADLAIGRKSEYSKWKQWLIDLLEEAKEIELKEFDLEEIYTGCKKNDESNTEGI